VVVERKTKPLDGMFKEKKEGRKVGVPGPCLSKTGYVLLDPYEISCCFERVEMSWVSLRLKRKVLSRKDLKA